MPASRPLTRLAAFVAALCAVPLLFVGTFFAFLGIAYGLEHPDPGFADGDPCCAHPDTFGQAMQGLGLGLLFAIGCVILTVLAYYLARVAATGRSERPGRRVWIGAPLSWLAIDAAYVALILTRP